MYRGVILGTNIMEAIEEFGCVLRLESESSQVMEKKIGLDREDCMSIAQHTIYRFTA